MRFSTALRDPSRRQIEELDTADILIGIPCYNNQQTIGHVVQAVTEGLGKYYPDMRSLVLVSDGGSVDDSREIVDTMEAKAWNKVMVTIYRGMPGKGCALRAIFEAAQYLQVKACLLFDSDLRSITPDWIQAVAEPILHDGLDYIAPYYKRYKYDGTITNNIVYHLTRTLYGKQVRQPIGGDFGLSQNLITELLTQDVWDTDIGKFGIDIWLTTNAIVRGFQLGQARLGVKIHDVKDPAESLGPMFRQVVATIFALMEEYENDWKQITGSEPVAMYGEESNVTPEPFTINKKQLVDNFKVGFEHFGPLWEAVLEPENYTEIGKYAEQDWQTFTIDFEWWVKTLYNFAVTYHRWNKNRFKLVTSITPLYNACIASFVTETQDISDQEAEDHILEDAKQFEALKPYLINLWDYAK